MTPRSDLQAEPGVPTPVPGTPHSTGVSVIVPAYDEESGIQQSLSDLRETLSSLARPWELLVIDDGSADGTAALAAGLATRVITHPTRLGYGASIKTGMRHATHSLIVITDADGTYPAQQIPQLLQAMETCEMAVGARIGPSVRIPPLRKPMKWFLRKLAEHLADTRIPDLNSGLRCFRKETMQSFHAMLPNGFSFTTTSTLAYHSSGLPVAYIPINYKERRGRSKIRPLRDSYNFLLLVFRTVMYFEPLRIFLPPALLSMTITAAVFAYEILVSKNLAESSLVWLTITTLLLGLGLVGDLIAKK